MAGCGGADQGGAGRQREVDLERRVRVVPGRLKRGGMRWSVDGANAILALRCRWLDDRYDEFFQSRSRPPPMALAA